MWRVSSVWVEEEVEYITLRSSQSSCSFPASYNSFVLTVIAIAVPDASESDELFVTVNCFRFAQSPWVGDHEAPASRKKSRVFSEVKVIKIANFQSGRLLRYRYL